jgi:hypothetical protein
VFSFITFTFNIKGLREDNDYDDDHDDNYDDDDFDDDNDEDLL